MASIEQQKKILDRIALLKKMQVSRGCTPGEQDVAASKLGRLIMEHDLHVSFNGHAAEDWSPYPKMPEYGSDDYYYGIVRVLRVTDKALLTLNTENQELWIPRSQLRRGCEDWQVGESGACYVSSWWIKKRGWERKV